MSSGRLNGEDSKLNVLGGRGRGREGEGGEGGGEREGVVWSVLNNRKQRKSLRISYNLSLISGIYVLINKYKRTSFKDYSIININYKLVLWLIVISYSPFKLGLI